MSHARFRSLWMIVGALAVTMVLAGCKHKPAPPAPAAPAAPPPAPTVTLNANPTSIQSGQSSTLTWSSQNATKVELNGAAVDLNGSQTVSPTESTDYEVVATGANGQTANATAHVEVTQPPPPPPPPAPAPQPSLADLWAQNIKPALFDYDKSNIRPDAQEALQADAAFLKAHPDANFTVAGHCDDRGSAEYNMGLGDRRANAVKDYLVQLGVDASRIQTISYGKEKPFCTEETEACWQTNRSAHLVLNSGNGGGM